MPRKAREKSDFGFYHVIIRGVNRQQIFECDTDYRKFVRILKKQTLSRLDLKGNYLEPHCAIYAYCLMGNHVHLLVKELDEKIGNTIKRISSAYVYYFNHKYKRVGHLFQERFKSQPVNDWDYFLTLVRYIHQNPVKAHIVKDLKEYQWSSWSEYIGLQEVPFCATDEVLKRISVDELVKLVEKPMTAQEEANCKDADKKRRRKTFSDDEVWGVIKKLCGAKNISEFQALPRPLQKLVLGKARRKGIMVKTLCRLTGASVSLIQQAYQGQVPK